MDSYKIDEFEIRLAEDEDNLEVWNIAASTEYLVQSYPIGPQDEAVKIWKDGENFCIAPSTMPGTYDNWNRNEYLFLQAGGGILAIDIRDAARVNPPILTYDIGYSGSYMIVQIDDENRINVHYQEGA